MFINDCERAAAIHLTASRLRAGIIREEELLAADLVVGDRLLTLARGQPFDEAHAERLFYMRMLRRVDQHDAILIEEPLVALDEDLQILPVLEGEPGAAIGEEIGVHRRRRVERRSHAGAGLAIPAARDSLHIDAGLGPEALFRLVGAAIVAARGE